MYNKLQTRREIFKSLFKMLQFSEQLFLDSQMNFKKLNSALVKISP